MNFNEISKDNSYLLDKFIKKIFFIHLQIAFLDQFIWITLTVVYITAQNTTSLFNSGFIVGCFFFLWHGQGLYLRPRKIMRRWWKTFIMYNFFVIMAKVWLQVGWISVNIFKDFRRLEVNENYFLIRDYERSFSHSPSDRRQIYL